MILSFPIIFQSFHAIEHHILEDNYHASCCSHQEKESNNHDKKDYSFVDTELELCPICEYQIVYFLDEKIGLAEQKFAFAKDNKTPILEHPDIEYRDCKNKLRGPPLV